VTQRNLLGTSPPLSLFLLAVFRNALSAISR